MTLPVIVAYAAGVLLILLFGRILLIPLKVVLRMIYNGLVGGLVLWLLNLIGAPLGYTLPVTVWTALIAGFFGLPGVAVLIVYYLFLGGQLP